MYDTFEQLRQDYYNRVPVSPGELKTRHLQYSDIVSHLPVLEYYASLCNHCVEFGMRDGNSTVALLTGCKGEVHSYDVNNSPIAPHLSSYPETKDRWHFHKQSTVDPDLEIPETDLLFLDTIHTHAHLSAELILHSDRVRRFLIFHDTFTCGERDVSGNNPRAKGISEAISNFKEGHPDFKEVYNTDRCNGLIILEKTVK